MSSILAMLPDRRAPRNTCASLGHSENSNFRFRRRCRGGRSRTAVSAARKLNAMPPLRSAPGFEKLAERQAQILDLLARGSDNTQIAAHLEVSDKTVRNQVSVILDVLGIESRGHAIVRAREPGSG